MFCFPQFKAEYDSEDEPTMKRSEDSSSVLSETSSTVPSSPTMGSDGKDDIAPPTAATEAETPPGTPRSDADSLPSPQFLSFEEPIKEEPAFGLEKVMRSISPLGWLVLFTLVFVAAKLTVAPNLASSLQPENVVLEDLDLEPEPEDASEGGIQIFDQTADFFKGLVPKPDSSNSQVQIFHPRIILAVPVMLVNTIHNFFKNLIGGATHNFAGQKVPRGVRGNRKKQPPTKEQDPKADNVGQKPEGKKKGRFNPGGFIRRLGRPKKAQEA